MKKVRLIFWVISRKATYKALFNALSVFEDPITIFYGLLTGKKFENIIINYKSKKFQIRIHSNEDIKTIIGVFCRLDYSLTKKEKVIVDIGANIGISSLYFLSSAPKAMVYAFEPFSQNINLLSVNININSFSDRMNFTQAAVSEDFNGTSNFYIEDTGKFCSLIKNDNPSIQVNTIDINTIIENILTEKGHIDVLKIDVEGLEEGLVSSIKESNLKKISIIYCENTNCYKFDTVNKNFDKSWYYNVERLSNKINFYEKSIE